MKKTIRPITTDQMADLGVDDDATLYWKGIPVKTEQRVKLSGMLNLAVILASVAAVVQAVCAVISLK